MSVNYTPNQNNYKDIGSFRFWCQKVLPLVYDDSLSYYELLNKVVQYLNDTIENASLVGEDMTKLYTAYEQLQEWTNEYFVNLDVPAVINNKLDTMASDGTLSSLIKPLFDVYKGEIDSIVRVQNDYMDVLNTRMNAFTQLPNGSTTGDAELQDIRTGWNGVYYTNAGESVRMQFKYSLRFMERLNAGNYLTLLPNVDEAVGNSVYELVFASGSTEFPANCPFTNYIGSLNTLFTFGAVDSSQKSQLFICNITGQMWVRQTGTGNVWYEWVEVTASVVSNVRVKPTDNLLEVLVNNKGKTIFVERGTYDIIEHYKDYLGEDYFDKYEGYESGGNYFGRGLPVYRGTKLYFAPGSKLVCNYTGSNTAVKNSFSAIALESDVTLHGLTLECKGVRDAIHDDFDNGYDGNTVIENCRIVTDIRCIAGGFGVSSNYVLQNNYFEVQGNGSDDVSYHNNSATGSLSSLVVKDNYFSKRLSVRYYGVSTQVSKAMVSNNSFASDVDVRGETADSNIVNIEVIKWNNVIR